MIDIACCKNHYNQCVCSRCKYDFENCCGKWTFTSYPCPLKHCGQFKEKTDKNKGDEITAEDQR